MTGSDDDATEVVARTEAELVAALERSGSEAVRVLGPTTSPPDDSTRIVRDRTAGMSVDESGCDADSLAFCGGVTVTVASGEPWDAFVATAVDREWVGLEALSGRPGTVGEVVAAGTEAFGRSVADTVAAVRTWDRERHAQRTLPFVDCAFGADGSLMSRDLRPDGTPRYVVLDVSFLLRQGDLTTPVTDERLAALLGSAPGERVPTARVRQAVLAHRATLTDDPPTKGTP